MIVCLCETNADMPYLRLRTGTAAVGNVRSKDSPQPLYKTVKEALPEQVRNSAFHRTHALLPEHFKEPSENLPLLIYQHQVM